MSSDVVLTSALRSNLLSLQKTQSNIDKVQNALSSGLKVSSALDNPQSYFTARSLNNRASDLSGLLDGIGQSISSLKQTNTAVEKVTKLVEQAQSIISQASDAAADAALATLVGDVDLSDVEDITDLAGIAGGNQLVIKVNNPDDPEVVHTITVGLSAGDSIDQVLTKINSNGDPSSTNATDNYDSAGEQIVEASIDGNGHLKIQAKNGGKMNVEFVAAETNAAADDAANLALARALGFGGQAQLVAQVNAAADNDVSITALPGNALVSGKFMKNGTSDEYADASAVLSTVYDDDSTSRSARFATSGSTTHDVMEITINNTTKASIDIVQGVTTIQGLVDGINNNATLKNYVNASYDATTGEFSIAKVSSKVQTIEIGNVPGAGATGTTSEMDFDFGLTSAMTSTTQTIDISEVFSFGASTGTLGQLEKDFNKVRDQIDGLIGDSAYSGANLLKGEDLVTYFNSDRSNSITTEGENLTANGLGLEKADFSSAETITGFRSAVKVAQDTLRSFAGSLSNDLSIIQNREEFTKETVSNLTEGADKLTVADQNEEGAKLLALQTRQSLGVTALSLAAQAQQSVLRLF